MRSDRTPRCGAGSGPRRSGQSGKEERKARRTALVRLPGSVELYLANLADLDPTWNVDGNDTTTGRNIDATLDAAESDDTRLVRLRAVLSDEAAAARYREESDRMSRREAEGGGVDRLSM